MTLIIQSTLKNKWKIEMKAIFLQKFKIDIKRRANAHILQQRKQNHNKSENPFKPNLKIQFD